MKNSRQLGLKFANIFFTVRKNRYRIHQSDLANRGAPQIQLDRQSPNN